MRKLLKTLFATALLICCFLLIIEGCLWIASLLVSRDDIKMSQGESQNRDGITVLTVGDSITAWGEENSYPSFLQKELNDRLRGVHVVNAGRGGATTADLLKELPGHIKKYQPDIVISLIGVNDIWSNVFQDHSLFDSWIVKKSRIVKFLKIVIANIKLRRSDLEEAQKKKKKCKGLFLQRIPSAELELDLSPAQYIKSLQPYIDLMEVDYSRCSIDEKAKELKNILSNALCYKSKNNFILSYSSFVRAYNHKESGSIHPRLKFEFAHVLSRLGKMHQAEKLINEFLPYSNVFEEHLDAALLFFNKVMYAKKNSEYLNRTAIKYFKSALRIEPDSAGPYYHIAMSLEQLKNYGQAELYFKRAIQLDSSESDYYFFYAALLQRLHRFDDAISLLERGKECLKHGNRLDVSFKLAKLYHEKGLFLKFDNILDELKREYPNSIQFEKLKELSSIQVEIEQDVEKQTLADKLYFSNLTQNNYRKIVQIILKSGAIPVILQYPNLKVDPLEKIFTSMDKKVLIENYDNFQSALKKGPYEELFVDYFGGGSNGQFGHFAPTGAALFAREVVKKMLLSDLIQAEFQM